MTTTYMSVHKVTSITHKDSPESVYETHWRTLIIKHGDSTLEIDCFHDGCLTETSNA